MDFISLNTMNNKFPCGGPRAVPIPLDFSAQGSYNVDLTVMVQRGIISDLQGFYVDNSQNANPLIIIVAIQNQPIIVPANSQAYLTALLGDPIFTASTTPSANLVVKMFALNFPVTNAVWSANAAGTPPAAVTIAGPLGQHTMAQSIPVTIASDQSALTVAISQIGGTVFSSAAFTSSGIGYLLNPTTASSSVAIVATTGNIVVVTNYGTETAFVNVSGASAALTDTAVTPGNRICFRAPATVVNAICKTIGTSLQIAVGTGAPQ